MASGIPSFSTSYIRPRDLLHLKFHFINLKPEKDEKKKYLVRVDEESPSYVVIELPPQHLSEQLLKEDEFTGDAINDIFLAGPSYLTLKVKFSEVEDKVRFNPETLLDWNRFELITTHDLESGSNVPFELDHASGEYPADGVEKLIGRDPNGAPISVFEVPFKFHLSPVLPKYRPVPGPTEWNFVWYTDNSAQEVDSGYELWINELLIRLLDRKGEKIISPSFRILPISNPTKIRSWSL